MTTLEQVYNECHSQIYSHALRVVKNVHDAEDIRSNVYLKIQRLESTKYDESKGTALSSWVHTVTNSVILDFFRTNHQDRYKAVSDFIQGDSLYNDSPFQFIAPAKADSDILNKELQSKIAKAFRTLKPKYRKIAILFFLRDLPYVEIAEIVDVPMGTVKGMLSRARQKLQAELDGLYNFKAVNVQNVEA